MPNPVEEAAAKGAGAAKAAAARLKGFHGVFSTLAKQHGEARVLLKRAESASEPRKQRDVWQKLRAELLSHEQGELKEVFPALAKHHMLQDVVRRHESHAEQLEAAIAEVDSAPLGSDAWKNSLKALHALLMEHVAEEEGEFFPLASEAMDKETAKAVDQRFKAAKNSIMDKLGVE